MTQDITEAQADPLDAATEAASTPETAATPGDLSAREAVRRAVVDLGPDADVEDVLAHLQAKFGLSPPRGTVQHYLYLLRREARDGVPTEPRRRGRPRRGHGNGQQPAPLAPAVEEVIDAVEVLRDLCDRLGDDNLRRLLDAL